MGILGVLFESQRPDRENLCVNLHGRRRVRRRASGSTSTQFETDLEELLLLLELFGRHRLNV